MAAPTGSNSRPYTREAPVTITPSTKNTGQAEVIGNDPSEVPPEHNFASLPRIRSERPAYDLHHPAGADEAGRPRPEEPA